MLSLNIIMHIIKINNNQTTQKGHTKDSNPSPLTQSKYSQPLELVRSHYPHLLIN